MILSDALSRRADQEEHKVAKQHMTMLDADLFVRLADVTLENSIDTAEKDEFHPEIAARLNEFLNGNTDKDWTIQQIEDTPTLFYRGKQYIRNNENLRQQLLQKYHDHPLAGHPGQQTTYWLLSKDYWWPGMPNYVRQYVRGCSACQQMKIDRRPWKGPLQAIPGTENAKPFSQLSMDLLTDLPPSDEGFDTILVVLDHGATKGINLIPTRKTLDAMGTAELLRDNTFKRFGLPDSIISDRDPRFASAAFQNLMKLLDVKSKLSTAYHPQTDGATERSMQEIEVYLSIYCLSNPTQWPMALSTLEFAYNSRPHADRTQSPFELMMGYQPRGLTDPLIDTKFPEVESRLKQLDLWRREAEAAHEIARQRMTERINQPLIRFIKSQKVWLDMRNLRTKYNKKITPKREGPFEIAEVLGPVTYRLKLPKTWCIHPVFHSILLKPFTQTPQYGPVKTKPPPDLIEGEEQYKVDHIVSHRRHKGRLSFLIQWKGYGPEEDSWEPPSNLKNAKETLSSYKKAHRLV